MKYKAFLGILLAFIILFSASWLFWLLRSEKELNIYVLDKTVPTIKRTEHASFFWLLNHYKYVKNNGESYDKNEDYMGFYPLEDSKQQKFDFKSIRIDEIESTANTYDLAYYTDTYGVYYNEWYRRDNQDVMGTERVYGGLNQNDYLLVKTMKERGKLILAEFNFFNAPTSALIREKLEDMLGINWSGWTGCYWKDLDAENGDIPAWIVKLYKEQNQNNWPFQGDGIVLVHKFGTILVLEGETHLNNDYLQLEATDEMRKRFGVRRQMNFYNWFDITYSGTRNTVLANFTLDVNEKGDSLLQANNLRAVFPAVSEYRSNYWFYYFAGDFAENNVSTNLSRFAGIDNLKFISSLFDHQKRFFWYFYMPMMKKILADYRVVADTEFAEEE